MTRSAFLSLGVFCKLMMTSLPPADQVQNKMTLKHTASMQWYLQANTDVTVMAFALTYKEALCTIL